MGNGEEVQPEEVKKKKEGKAACENFICSLRFSTKNLIKQCCSPPTRYAATSPRTPWLPVLESPNPSFPPSGSQ